MSKNNYEISLQEARKIFLCYKQSVILQKFSLEHDDRYLYIDLFARRYRIDRATGVVGFLDERSIPHEADFNVSLSIYDILCGSQPNRALSGQFAPINSVASNYHTKDLGGSVFGSCPTYFSEHPEKLEKALIALGGVKEGKGDIAYRINTFPFLPIRVQFWEADEDFPASFQILWDTNTLQYLRYETTYYVAGHLLHRLRELMEKD